MGNNCINDYLEYAKPLYSEKDVAHNFEHIERMIKRIKFLGIGYEEQIKPELLWFLTCFHGLNSTFNDFSSKKQHCIDFLMEKGWSNNDISIGFECLNRHLNDPITLEEQIVHDANFIELLGAFGIAKAFTTGGSHGQSYYETIRIYEEEYLDNVIFHTERGKELAVEGKEYAKSFLSRLKQELEY